MYKRLAPAAVAAISNGITIGDANPPVPTSATIVKKLDPPMSEIVQTFLQWTRLFNNIAYFLCFLTLKNKLYTCN